MSHTDALQMIRDYIAASLYKMASDKELGTAVDDAGLALSDETLMDAAQVALDALLANRRYQISGLMNFYIVGSGAWEASLKTPGGSSIVYAVRGEIPVFVINGGLYRVTGTVDWPENRHVPRITVASVTEA